jgi:hypothetical protein
MPNKALAWQHCKNDNKYIYCTTTPPNGECRQKLFVQCKSGEDEGLIVQQRYVYFITPTLPTRTKDLKWLSNTFSTLEYSAGVRIHWIVIEDMEQSSVEVEETMRVACQGARTARFTHLHMKKRKYNEATKSRGVEQRNLGMMVVRAMLQRADVDRERSMVGGCILRHLLMRLVVLCRGDEIHMDGVCCVNTSIHSCCINTNIHSCCINTSIHSCCINTNIHSCCVATCSHRSCSWTTT